MLRWRFTPLLLSLGSLCDISSAAFSGIGPAAEGHLWRAHGLHWGRRCGRHVTLCRTQPAVLTRLLCCRSLGATLPLRGTRQRTEGGEGAERWNDGRQGDVDYLQTWNLCLGAGAALGGGIGSQNLQPKGGIEGEPLLVQQLGGCQACVGQPHDVERLKAHWLNSLSLQASDLPQREAGYDATDWFLDHNWLRMQALWLGWSVRSW